MSLISKKIIVNIMLAAISSACCLLAAELILSNPYFADLAKDDERVSFKTQEAWADCYTSDARHYFPVVIKDSSQERVLHCVFYDPQKRRQGYFPQRRRQVAIVGDSFAFGQGVKSEDTIGCLLGRKFGTVNFKNFAGQGMNIADAHAEVLRILKEEKDIKDILYFYNLNDVLISEEIAQGQKLIFDIQNVVWRKMEKPRSPIAAAFSGSVLFRLLTKTFVISRESGIAARNYLDMYFGRSNAKELRESVALLTAMNKAAKESGARFYFIIYPLFYKDILGRYPFLPVHRFLEKTCNANGIKCIDLYPVFKKYYSLKRFIVNPVDYHPNDLANKMVADYLAKNGDFPFGREGH